MWFYAVWTILLPFVSSCSLSSGNVGFINESGVAFIIEESAAACGRETNKIEGSSCNPEGSSPHPDGQIEGLRVSRHSCGRLLIKRERSYAAFARRRKFSKRDLAGVTYKVGRAIFPEGTCSS